MRRASRAEMSTSRLTTSKVRGGVVRRHGTGLPHEEVTAIAISALYRAVLRHHRPPEPARGRLATPPPLDRSPPSRRPHHPRDHTHPHHPSPRPPNHRHRPTPRPHPRRRPQGPPPRRTQAPSLV